jgi:hypothetical protein
VPCRAAPGSAHRSLPCPLMRASQYGARMGHEACGTADLATDRQTNASAAPWPDIPHECRL